jgi:hypothetical protein
MYPRLNCPTESAITKFEKNGPFIFEAVLDLVKLCEKRREKDWLQINRTLDYVASKFSLEEFTKLINAKDHCTPLEYKQWKSATELWTIPSMYPKLNDEQLEQLASHEDFEALKDSIAWEQVPTETRLVLLKTSRDFMLKEHKAWKQRHGVSPYNLRNSIRDASPVRK